MTWDDFWVNEFGKAEFGIDFAGKKIKRSEQGKNAEFGWTGDHILPEAQNGPDNVSNLQITNFKTNQHKADKNTFVIDGIQYQVLRNTPKNIKGKRLANYNYNEKKYCIIIVGGVK
jgi:hypothetical protein